MNVERCSISTCRVGHSSTKLLWKPIHTPCTRGGCIEPPWEEDLLCLQNVWRYLQQGRWFRSSRCNGVFSLGSSEYYIGKPFARRCIEIRFDPDPIAFICQPEGSEELVRVPAQGLTKAELMGELAAMQALPAYQVALPFSREAWRQCEYANHLIGTALGNFEEFPWVRLYGTQQALIGDRESY